MENLEEKLARVTNDPGVYLMRDAEGEILYVGKARNLKKRLASYFKASGPADMKTGVLVSRIADFETIITRTEKEALILESNLIKRHRPRYNVILKDDKRYPSLRLDIQNPYPNLSIVRKPERDGALYFGPFASAGAVRETLKIIQKNFRLRKCRNRELRKRTRPCLHCQMAGCLAPCCTDVDPARYDAVVRDVILFLKGRTPDLIRKIKAEMEAAALNQEFERAAFLRDRMFALEKTLEKQVSVTTDFQDRDVFALARTGPLTVVTGLFVRGGYLQGTRHFDFTETLSEDPETVGSFIRQYYEEASFVPKEILVPVEPEDREVLEEYLSLLKGEKVSLHFPQRGEKARLLQIAAQNAENRLREILAKQASESDLLRRLQERLRITRLPVRIECFDNSNISGTEPVSSMVVFENGKPKKSDYRHFRIKTVAEHNDYAYMAEVLTRRLGKGEGAQPDLLMVDGGRGQVGIAVAVFRELGMEGDLDLVGIAKRDDLKGETEDKIFKPGRSNPVIFGRDHDLLLFLMRIRDEAHRFAITFHRKRRRKTALRSVLDAVSGVGPKRKKLLLQHFGSIKKIRAATKDELMAVPGITEPVARAVKAALDAEPL